MAQRPPCCECGVTAPAYRCSICYSFYCSVTCCKEHKSKICTLPVKEDVTPDNQYQFPTEDTVEIEKLALLKENEELKQILKDPQLQTMLKDINNHPNPGKALKFFMQQKNFCDFTDVIMKIIEPDKSVSENIIQDM